MPAFVPFSGAWTGTRASTSSGGVTRIKKVHAARTSRPPRASLVEVASAGPTSLLVAENLYGTIFLGGIGIIGSGLVGAFIVNLLARGSYEDLERDFVYRDMSPEERADLERRDVVLQTVRIAEEKLKENPFLQPDDEIAAEED